MSLASKYAKDVFCVTKRALIEEQRASGEVPVPHFASVIKLLIAVIERVEVRLLCDAVMYPINSNRVVNHLESQDHARVLAGARDGDR